MMDDQVPDARGPMAIAVLEVTLGQTLCTVVIARNGKKYQYAVASKDELTARIRADIAFESDCAGLLDLVGREIAL